MFIKVTRSGQRRYGEFVEWLEPFHSAQCVPAQSEVLGEIAWSQLRLVVAHDPQVASAMGACRDLFHGAGSVPGHALPVAPE